MKRVRSYTAIWNVEKVLYAINDWELPISLSYTAIMWLVFSELFVAMFANRFPFSMLHNVLLKYIGIPVLVTWFMSKKTFDGKRPYSYFKGVLAYLLRSRLTYRGRPVTYRKRKCCECITVVRSEGYVIH